MSYANQIRYDRNRSHADISNEAVDKINFSIEKEKKKRTETFSYKSTSVFNILRYAHIVCLYVIIASSFQNICLKVLTVNGQWKKNELRLVFCYLFFSIFNYVLYK